MPKTDRPALRIRTLTDLVELVPRLLGFNPLDSLVLIVLEEGRIALTARVDLPGEGDATVLVAQMAPVIDRHSDATLLALAYCSQACEAWSVLATFGDHLPSTTPVLLVHVDGRRWHQAPDDEGTPYDDRAGLMAVRAAVEGLAVLPDRRALAATLDPAHSPREVGKALKRHERRRLTREQRTREALALVDAIDRTPRAPTLDEAVLLTIAAHDREFHRAAMLSTCRRNAQVRRDLWVAVVRSSPPRLTGQALVLLGLAAWVGGDGALMVVCLERLDGLAVDVEWVDFLSDVNARVMHPAEWEQIRADLACEALEAEVTGGP